MGQEHEIVIADEQPGAAPGLSFGDLRRWAPVIDQVITALKTAIAGGQTQIPAIKIRVAGKRLTLGPTPISVEGSFPPP